ncbi:NACHT domain-containing NTPase [Corallococcus sp. AB011P]|uniref:NACHT domain-containing protein n=2 Tax=Myxococcaceae TaxID=31 RepID=UPI0011C3A942|nr:ATP-binding protein [Corallococcus sp. AB011P]
MPALNWDIFTGLPGSAEKNFELLCRGIVRQNFGSFGAFRALANQPGVEFHLKLDKHCDELGDPGRWWGWQCKWYDLAANGALGATRRAKIEEGLRKTEAHLPDLTDWVLWTRRTLTKDDQDWFNGLSSKMKLHLWTGDEVDNHLAGQAAVLRSTYFGELVLTPDILRERHEQAVAPIRARWKPEVHHVGESERELRRMLGEAESWDELSELSAELRTSAEAIEASPPVPHLLAPFVTGVVATSRQSADTLDKVAAGIRSGDLDLLRDEFAAHPRALPVDVATAPRRLRSGNYRAGLYATNAVADCHDAIRLFGDVEAGFSSRLVAVIAPAGCGKTHLAAQLTAGATTRPHGVLLHGRDLHATYTLDDLARRVSIAARPVPSMESLLAAVDAAGQRARHRLPVFIDGLNESEDPRTWKPLLASLETILAKYPYVLLVCTLRPEFVDDALPDGTRRVEIKDYGNETIEAVHEHFRYWKIDATDASLPGFLRHPLTLRLFCEVTNPTRQRLVGANAMPGSLTALFERYLEQVGVRVVELAPRAHRFYAHDVNAAIATIANKLWESRARSIELAELRSLLGDAQRPWDQSLVRALEHEGVLLRMPSNGSDTFVPVYDLLGGHVISNALLAKHGQSTFETWIKEPSTTTLLAGGYDVRHPLAGDIVVSLVGQVPRRFRSKQLWQLVDEPLRGNVLRLAAHLEPAFLDAVTVDELLDLVRAGDAGILDHLWQVRGMPGHPLNAEALDRTLRTMTVADRDLRWTEWLRKNHDDVLARGRSVLRDLELLEQSWRSKQVRTGDRLRARWVMWTLTSTVRWLRDQATRTLYWFGRVDPEGLFSLTIDSLSVNDAYVGERMLAAAYGIVISHQHADAEFAAHLKLFLEQLESTLVGPSASAPTHHYLARLYVRGIVAFAEKFYASALSGSLSETWSFAGPAPVQPLASGDAGADEAGRTLHMDFKNYTLGRLFEDRSNYDMDHAGHQAAVAHVRGVVSELGWRTASFDALDRRIAEDAYRHGRGNRSPVERYGKKYGWIGFFTYAGLLEDRGHFPRTSRPFSAVDIDPSFPEKPPTDGRDSVPEAWLSPTVESHEDWVRKGTTSLPIGIIRRDAIGGHPGPWLAVHGYVIASDRVLGRDARAFISALVVSKESEPRLVSALKAGARSWEPRDVPSDHYIFAGEIPWHPNFASVALSEGAYCENVRVDTGSVDVEVLAHGFAWESHHSEMNRAGSARVPSQPFSHRFDLRSAAQSFDQFLPDGSRATITLSGVDGLDGDILYVREDLLRQYAGGRAIVWFAFGERELRPYPSSPPQWLVDAQRRQENEWHVVFTEADIKDTEPAGPVNVKETVDS